MYIDRAASVRFALAFPNTYRVGMASLGYQLVYRMLNSLPNASCERVFLPDADDLKEHIRSGTELFTLESQSPLSEFDVVAFSISFEIDYLSVLQILRLGNLPLASAQRDDQHPLVIAGGPCATFNPEPLADFIDAFVIGDAENVLGRLVDTLESAQDRGHNAQCAALAMLSGVYIPRFYSPEYGAHGEVTRVRASRPAPETVRRSITADLSRHPGNSIISTADAEFGDIELVEVARGCGRKCRFCVAGHINRPPRPRGGIETSNSKRFGLVGAAVFDHPEAESICERIVECGGEFSVSSVRLETVNARLTELMSRGGQKTLTIAPEAGSERLRRVINKNSSDEEMCSAVSAARDAGFRRMKLYFMIGLPTETDEDIEAIVELVRRLSLKFPTMSFQASASSFVPKPWTPFQWHPMERENVLKRRFGMFEAETHYAEPGKIQWREPEACGGAGIPGTG